VGSPPARLGEPRKDQAEVRDHDRKELQRLQSQIRNGMLASTQSKDRRSRQEYDLMITGLRDELEMVEARLAAAPVTEPGYTKQECEALLDWWNDFEKKALSLPVPSKANLDLAGGLHQDPNADESAILVDPRKVNEVLHELGARITLLWETEKRLSSKGVEHRRHNVVDGRFQLGQQNGRIGRSFLGSTGHRAL
jgi:hypothetical protein